MTETARDPDDQSSRNGRTDRRVLARRQYDREGVGEVTVPIVEAIAEAAGVDPVELSSPPLYDSVDVSAMEEGLFGTGADATLRSGVGVVEFRYTDYLVSVHSDGSILVFDADET